MDRSAYAYHPDNDCEQEVKAIMFDDFHHFTDCGEYNLTQMVEDLEFNTKWGDILDFETDAPVWDWAVEVAEKLEEEDQDEEYDDPFGGSQSDY